MFKALYDLVEYDLPCGQKLSKFNLYNVFSEVRLNFHFDDLAFWFKLMPTKELFSLTNLYHSVVYLKIKCYSNSVLYIELIFRCKRLISNEILVDQNIHKLVNCLFWSFSSWLFRQLG